MKKCLIGLMLLSAMFMSGCTGELNSDMQAGENFFEDVPQFVLVKKISDYHYIVADRDTHFEYYVSRTSNRLYVIGGNVLDKDGHPKKFEKE
jgi:hypothetical protein